jgi:hypothetical protein
MRKSTGLKYFNRQYQKLMRINILDKCSTQIHEENPKISIAQYNGVAYEQVFCVA